jgi:hypothetical protein
MRPAQYAVIRYIADPARGEALNVGILAWVGEQYRLRVDEAATRRVIRDNPFLHSDALAYLGPHVRDRLEAAMERAHSADQAVSEVIGAQKGFPILLTEPRSTTLRHETAGALDEVLDRLVKRLVTPRRRGGGGRSPAAAIEKKLQPLIAQNLVRARWPFRETRSGVVHTVSFFANSGANVALDAISLVVSDGDEIRQRGAAEAYKAEDILLANKVRFLTYCALTDRPEFREPQNEAIRMLEAVGAEVIHDPAEAADRVAALVGKTETAA